MTTSFTIPEHLESRLESVLPAGTSVSQFALGAFEERINRLEARNERARLQQFQKDKELLRPIVDGLIEERLNNGFVKVSRT